MKVYVLIERNSPELQNDAGAQDLIAVYKDWNKARAAALERAESYGYSDYQIVDRYDERPEGERIGYTLYQYGNEDSPCWFDVVVEPMEFVDEIIMEFKKLHTSWLDEDTFSFAFDGGIDDEGNEYSISCEYHSDTNSYIFTRWYGDEEAEAGLTKEQEECIKAEMKKYIKA